MARMGIDKNVIIYRAAQLANDVGVENITLKALANNLDIQTTSLYNHIGGLDDLKKTDDLWLSSNGRSDFRGGSWY